MLVGASPVRRIGVFSQSGVDLHHGRAARRDLPAVKRPEMHPLAQLPAQVQQPRYAGMRGLGDLARHVEVKHRLGRAGPFLRQAAPAGIAGAIGAVAVQTVADEIDIHVVFIGRPVPLEVFEERRPIGRQVVNLEIPQWKRKAMVDADQRRHVFGDARHQPFRNAAPRPVSARAGRWGDFLGWRGTIRMIDAQALQA